MNIIFQIFTRISNLMLHSAKEWDAIATENRSRKAVYVQFVAPLLCLMTIASIIGTWFNASRELYSSTFELCRIAICQIAILWTSISVGLYFSSFLITEILAQQIGSKDHNKSFAMMAYASSAAYLTIIIVLLFPFFYELLILAFYSCYLYWRGIPRLIQINGQKRMIYGIFSFIIVLLIFSLMFFLFNKIWRAILV